MIFSPIYCVLLPQQRKKPMTYIKGILEVVLLFNFLFKRSQLGAGKGKEGESI